MADENGRLIAGRYRLGSLLGQGGMGFVWQAHDQVLDREVAVKEVFVPGHDEDREKRAFREARAAARLNHPGIVTIHDLVSADGRSWIVMELVPAPSLDGVLRESGPLPPDRVARIGLALLDALQAAHRAGILHRDIKPANVLLPGDRAVITDFGIATIAGDDKLTATGQVIGTPAYMPPERLRGEPASEASDMWALGATLYAAVTGHAPSAGAVTDAGPLAPVLQGLLRDDPRTRLTAGQASALIESQSTVDTPAMTVTAGQPTLPGPQHPRQQMPAGRRRRRPPRLVLAGAGLAAVAATAIVLAVTLSSNPPAGQEPVIFTPSTEHTASPSLAPSTAPPAADSSASASVPHGYSVYTDHAHHFSAAIPDTWVASTEGPGLRFCAPGGCPEVIFVQRLTAGSDPIVDIRNTSAGNGSFPAPDYSGYHRLRLGPVSYFAQAAEAEFTLHKRGTPSDLHGRARVFTITSGGQEYFVQMTALSATWDRSQPIFNAFFATFRPAS